MKQTPKTIKKRKLKGMGKNTGKIRERDKITKGTKERKKWD
jgi:hypothetical protein